MEFKLKVNMDNEAFFSDGEFELVRILKEVTSFFEKNGVSESNRLPLLDYNGNKVGYFEIEG